MIKAFQPRKVAQSIYDIDFKALYAQGFRGLILDIDNTLVPDNAKVDERSIKLLSQLQDLGFDTVILSNNDEARVKPFADAVGSKYLFKVLKPKKRGYEDGAALMALDKSQVVCIGDQIFTDIWGANRAGMLSILTKPLEPSTERRSIKLKRIFEKLVYSPKS